MAKAFFIDFYGTIVHEDGEIIRKVTDIIYGTGKAGNTSEIDSFWWNEFQTLFRNSFGESFETQRALETESIRRTLAHFHSDEDAEKLSNMLFDQWVRPEIFEDSSEFFSRCTIPVYIVSNIDTADILSAIEYHGLKPSGVFTSEEARSYKPRPELFELALRETGLKPEDVIHIGDSISSDIRGAGSVGIRALWLNRFGKAIPDGIESIRTLPEALERL